MGTDTRFHIHAIASGVLSSLWSSNSADGFSVTTLSEEQPRPEDPFGDNPAESTADSQRDSPRGNVSGESHSGSGPVGGDDPPPDEAPVDKADEGIAADLDDDLPEWEPLTPEILEEEALRGDFMLRWAVVLLAALVGCLQIGETDPLVHVRSGQQLLAHGFIPQGQDTLSATAAGRNWTNSSWLFDIGTAAVYGLSGWPGVVLVKAAVCALIFYLLVDIALPGIPTWWTAIVGGLALAACMPSLTARPELVTLLGLTSLLWLLFSPRPANTQRLWYLLPLLFLFWGNLDPRVFIGLAVLGAHLLGTWLDSLRGSANVDSDESRLRALAGGSLFSLAACLANPFGWKVWTAPWQMYVIEFPRARDYFSRLNPRRIGLTSAWMDDYWSEIDPFTVAACLLLVAALISLALNWKRLRCGWAFPWMVAVVFGVICRHELATVAIVSAVIAGLSGQEWYRWNFRQEYSVDTAEVIFSRGGRAVTVLAFFAIAFTIITGRLVDLPERRIGLGLTLPINRQIDGLGQALRDDRAERIFNFVPVQGDLLIWLGRKPFVDNRLSLYVNSSTDLLSVHEATRRALRGPLDPTLSNGQDAAPKTEIWKTVLDQYDIYRTIPRLSGASPDYVTFFGLLNSGDWELSELGSVGAVFRRPAPSHQAPEVDCLKHSFDANRLAFVDPMEPTQARTDWARPASIYDNYFTRPFPRFPNDVQLARHFSQLLSVDRHPPGYGLQWAYLAIRSANRGLLDDPDSPTAYSILGNAYSYIGSVENQLMQQGGSRQPNWLRYFQTIAAFNQSLILDPRDVNVLLLLSDTYYRQQKFDLALNSLDRFDELYQVPQQLTETDKSLLGQNAKRREALAAKVDEVTEQVNRTLQEKGNRTEAAALAYQAGCSLLAMRTLDEDPIELVQNAAAQQLHAIVLFEAGRLDKADLEIQQLLLMAQGRDIPVGWQSLAAITAISLGDYERAISQWKGELKSIRAAMPDPAQRQLQEDSVLMQIAMAQIESGRVDDARKQIARFIFPRPRAPFHVVAQMYHDLLTGTPGSAEDSTETSSPQSKP